MPVTMTRPRQSRQSWQAWSKEVAEAGDQAGDGVGLDFENPPGP